MLQHRRLGADQVAQHGSGRERGGYRSGQLAAAGGDLQTAGASPGRDKPKRTPFNVSFNPLPSQEVEQGTEPLLYGPLGSSSGNPTISITAR